MGAVPSGAYNHRVSLFRTEGEAETGSVDESLGFDDLSWPSDPTGLHHGIDPGERIGGLQRIVVQKE
jgi:hypothetical protein